MDKRLDPVGSSLLWYNGGNFKRWSCQAIRLDKFLVDCGIGSRSQVKTFLKKKQVQVNGKLETSPKRQIDEVKDEIAYAGQFLQHETFVYYLLYKPKGVVSATEDDQHRTVLDLLDETARHKQVFPLGRLDIDTTGLLLLTNNGPLAHALCCHLKSMFPRFIRLRWQVWWRLRTWQPLPRGLS